MTVKDLIKIATDKFTESKIESPFEEAKFLILGKLDITPTEYLMYPDNEVSGDVTDEIYVAVERRLSGEPLQYILGKWDFMGRTFEIGEGVLIPRPETEILCQKGIEFLRKRKNPVVYDLCTGSGCIGITLNRECPGAEVSLVEKSRDVYKYLNNNVENFCRGSFINIILGDVLRIEDFECLCEADLIISNPPYIKSSEIPTLQKEVGFEPKMALDGGEDGLEFYRYIINNWSKTLKYDGEMMFEIGEDQGEAVSEIFEKAGFYSKIIKDYNNNDRIVIGRRTPYDI